MFYDCVHFLHFTEDFVFRYEIQPLCVWVCVCVWVSVWVSEWVCEWVSVWVSEWVGEWVCVCDKNWLFPLFLDIWYHPMDHALLSYHTLQLSSTSKSLSLNWPMSHAPLALSRTYWACSEQWLRPLLITPGTSSCNYVGRRLQYFIASWWHMVRSSI